MIIFIYYSQWKRHDIPKESSIFRVWFQRSLDYYDYIELYMKLHIYLIILWAKINKKTGEIQFSTNNNEKKPMNIKDLKEMNKNRVEFDFDFKNSQKRQINEYDDLQIYISKKQNYIITQNDEENKFVERVNFGVIDTDHVKYEQHTSTNVWMSMLDNNLAAVTNKKLNLAYFENTKCNFWMNLNETFFFETKNFVKFQKEYFYDLDKNDVIQSLNEITKSCSKDKKQGTVHHFYNLFILLYILIYFNR